MKMHAVSRVFDEINKHTSRLVITALLAELFKEATPQEAKILSYLSLGMLRAPYEGLVFSLAEKNVIKVLAELLHVTPKEIQDRAHQYGDLGLVAAEGGWQHTSDLSLVQVYDELIDLATMSGVGSQEEKIDRLLRLLRSVDPQSACYIVRIVLGTLRLGFSDMTLIDALSWMLVGSKKIRDRIEQAYNNVADIGHVAYILKKDGIEGLERIVITVGIPIRPAAAERLPTPASIIEKIGPCVAQPKLDGFRLQVHIKREKGMAPHVWFFSRNLQNMSAMFPELVTALQHAKVTTIIAEGEAIAYNESTGEFVPFQETVKRKRKHGIEEIATELPLKLFLFDILYLNSEVLLDKPHYERRALLTQLFPVDHLAVVSSIDEIPIDSAKMLEDFFQVTVSAGLEGLVIKRPNAPYQPGKRNFNWIKLKRHAEGELEDTIDTVVLGYYFGSGKRAAFGIGAFLVGLYDKQYDRFVTVAKVGTGLKDADWKDLKQRCDAIRVHEVPHNVLCPPELVPDVWVDPRIVCAIRADEITQSPIHSAGKTAETLGLALRFPRFVGYRSDKAPEDATTVHELQRLYQDQFKKKA